VTDKIPISSRRDFLKVAGAASLASLLAACAGAPAPSAPTAATQAPAATTEPTLAAAPAAGAITIRFGRHDPVDGDLENVKTFEAKYPNIKVQQEQIADFAIKVPALVAAGTLPDVLRSWEAMAFELMRAGQLLDETPFVNAQADFNADDFYANWYNYPVLDGKRIGVPDVIAPHVTFLNLDLFEKNGVEVPDPANFTWDDYIAKAKAMSDPDNKVWGSSAIPVGWTYYTLKQVWQNGGDYFTPDYMTSTVDKPETIEAIQFWADQMLTGDVMPSPTQMAGVGGADAESLLFDAGQQGMQRIGSWVTQNAVNAKFKFNIVPEPSKARRDTILHGGINAINSQSPNKNEAWLWVNHRTGTQGIYNYAYTGKFQGARRTSNQIEPHPWVAETDFDVNWAAVPETGEYGHVLPAPANEQEALKPLTDALEKIYNGSAKAADILPPLVPQINQILQS
jgi:multiple sugar transport system substrate-binding protein